LPCIVFEYKICQNNNSIELNSFVSLSIYVGTCQLWNHFLDLAKLYGRHIVYADGGRWYYHENQLHSLTTSKNIIGRVPKYVTARTENFDDYYHCISGQVPHVYKWPRLFVFMHNLRTSHIEFSLLTRIIRDENI
jgi:hypothetical protein